VIKQLPICTNNANILTSFTVWVDHLPLEGKEKEEREEEEGREEEEEEEELVSPARRERGGD